jgi:hypothetical protein
MPNKSAYHWYLRNSAFWREQRVTIFRRAKGRCEWCGRPATQVHHLNYRRVFNELANLQLALSVADELYVLSSGRFVFQGTPTDLAKETQVLDQHLGVSDAKIART